MSVQPISIGDIVVISALFETAAGADIDPTAVFCKVRDPSGNVSTLQYGVDGALVKDSIGNYHADIDADEAGTWYYRFYSTGTGKAADESSFEVSASQF